MEIVDYLIILSCSVLNRLGGSIDKNYRRFGIGLALSLYGILRGVPWYLALICVASSQILRLPITLFGNDVRDDWFNWVWFYAVSVLYSLSVLPLCLMNLEGYFIYASLFGLITGTLFVLSNIKLTSEIFKWDIVEYIYGGLIGFIATKGMV